MNESAFEYLNQQKNRDSKSRIAQFIAPDANIYTCTIGLKSTNANYYLEQAEISFTLKKLKMEPIQRSFRSDGRRVQSQANFHDSGNFLFAASRPSIQPRPNLITPNREDQQETVMTRQASNTALMKGRSAEDSRQPRNVPTIVVKGRSTVVGGVGDNGINDRTGVINNNRQ